MPRVLTVEDEPDLRLILQDNLEFEGYEVLSASTGEEGLDLAMAKQPDLVLLDLLLPRMSGYEVCRRLRAGHSRCRSSCSPPGTRRWIASPGWSSAPTTTWASRSG